MLGIEATTWAFALDRELNLDLLVHRWVLNHRAMLARLTSILNDLADMSELKLG